MSAAESSLLAQWWCRGVSAIGPAGPLAPRAGTGVWLAAAVTGAVRSAQRAVERWSQPEQEPQSAEELLEYAFRIGRDHPGLAADLRAAALRHQAATD